MENVNEKKKLSELTLTELLLLANFLKEIGRRESTEKVFNEILDRIELVDFN